jgi:hypothetical protein
MAPRNYKSEYANYHAKPEQRERNNARKRARYDLEKRGVVSKGDGKDIDHKIPLSKGGTNRKSNLKLESASSNRSFTRNSNHTVKINKPKKK